MRLNKYKNISFDKKIYWNFEEIKLMALSADQEFSESNGYCKNYYLGEIDFFCLLRSTLLSLRRSPVVISLWVYI